MFKSNSALFLLLLIPALVFAASAPTITHVVYITLDGVRWQDIYLSSKHFKKLRRQYGDEIQYYGKPDAKESSIEAASIPLSLPSYESQLSGSVQPCMSNECGRIEVETFAEQLVHHGVYKKEKVAVFSSWEKINLATETHPGTIFTNTGNSLVYDPLTQRADKVMQELNRAQLRHHPLTGDRFDLYTFDQALHYLIQYQPQFLWISFNDADEAAHRGDRITYNLVLNFYDWALVKLLNKLKELELYDHTLIIITTDHGRGNGDHWTSHGTDFPESKRTWAFTLHGNLHKDPFGHYSTLSIRPTVEGKLLVSNNL